MFDKNNRQKLPSKIQKLIIKTPILIPFYLINDNFIFYLLFSNFYDSQKANLFSIAIAYEKY